jgi:hypothetical protein
VTKTTETFYVSKYAMTDGIQRREMEATSCGQYAKGRYDFLKIGKDCHRTFGAALNAAVERKQKRIASLKKQLKAAEAMTFAEPAETTDER